MESVFYTAENIDEDIRKKSSSGGIFFAIAGIWFKLHPDGYVCGCIMDENLKAKHIIVSSLRECEKMRGAKYIPSNLGECIKTVIKLLRSKKFVLFSGTPCQIWGMKQAAEKNNCDLGYLYTIEVICHGVAKQQFFADYINYLEVKYRSKAISCNFRAKKFPGDLQDMEVIFANKKIYHASSTRYDWFYSLYNYYSYAIRESCFSCRFANPCRNADISLGDAWDSALGRSLVVINTEKGYDMFALLDNRIKYCSTMISEKSHPNFFHPTEKPSDYDYFWNIYNESGFLEAQKYIGNNTAKGKIRSLLALIIYRLRLKKYVKFLQKLIRKSSN